MSYIREKLWHEYGIKVKTIRIWGTPNYYGETYYLPYTIKGCNAGCIVDLCKNQKVYNSLNQILEAAQKGELELL